MSRARAGNSILVVGTVAIDSIFTPGGASGETLGGSASYFALSASHFAGVSLVSVVGEDFPAAFSRRLERENIDLSGLERVPGGRTFRWEGEYDGKLKQATTRSVSLNVLEGYRPVFRDRAEAPGFLFLANIDPEVQLAVIDRHGEKARLIVCDTMNYWLANCRGRVLEVLARSDVLLINDEEAALLTGERHVVRAGRKILGLGPRAAVIKRGEYGAALFSGPGECFLAPAFPTEKVIDPTGAGDSFGGGFTGYLAETGDFSEGGFRRAVAHGIVAASFTVESFSSSGLEGITRPDIDRRCRQLREMTRF